jgi:hypothetical protein
MKEMHRCGRVATERARLDLLPSTLAAVAYRHDEDVAVHIDSRGDIEHALHETLRRLRKWLAVG